MANISVVFWPCRLLRLKPVHPEWNWEILVRRFRVFACCASLAWLAVLLTGCLSQDRRRLLDEPVEPKQKTQLLDAMQMFRERFNAGSCQIIYEQAAKAFRSSSPQDWQSVCEGMRADLGIWYGYRTDSLYYCSRSPDIICMVGLAQFTKESRRLQLAWWWNRKEAELFFLDLQKEHLGIRFPPETQRLIDPPAPRRNKEQIGGVQHSRSGRRLVNADVGKVTGHL